MEPAVEFSLKYGRESVTLSYPDELTIHATPDFGTPPAESDLIRAALKRPLGCGQLRPAEPTDDVVIVISDITRPTPSHRVLPYILDALGPQCRPTVIVASGNHRDHSRQELDALVGPCRARLSAVIDHNHEATTLVSIGQTQRGTPIHVSRRYLDADFRITLGHVAFHPFAGYSGGAKLVIPGLASGETIRINHQLANDPAATSGRVVGNPVREDLEEAFATIAPEFAVSLILDLDHRVVGCTTGSADLSHQAAMKLHDRYYRPEIRTRGDVAIVSPGGFPKDIDFRQSSKALEYAARGIKTGGSILLVAACTDGIGSADMEAIWRANSCAAEVATLCETTFPAGAQRVLPTARIARDFEVLIYSSLDANLARELFLSPVGTAAAVLQGWQAEHKQLLVIPSSGIEPSIR